MEIRKGLGKDMKECFGVIEMWYLSELTAPKI